MDTHGYGYSINQARHYRKGDGYDVTSSVLELVELDTVPGSDEVHGSSYVCPSQYPRVFGTEEFSM